MTQQLTPRHPSVGSFLRIFSNNDPLLVQSTHDGEAFAEVMNHINADSPIPAALARKALLAVLNTDSPSRDAELGSLLMGSVKVATPQTIRGFIEAVGDFESKDLCTQKTHVLGGGETVIGCAGSGKKGRKTINITTPAMIIAAAAGARILKAGSQSTSSLTGSTDILLSQGFVVPETIDKSTSLLYETGFGFYSIENMIPKFDRVYGGKFFAPHALSYALPAALIPVGVDSLLYGYAGPKVLTSAMALAEVGFPSALVCASSKDNLHYIDEISTEGMTYLAGVRSGKPGDVINFSAKKRFNIKKQTRPSIDSTDTLDGQSDIFESVIAGGLPNSAAENTICANAATMLYLANKCQTPEEGYAIAKKMIREKKAGRKLTEIVEASKDINGVR